MNTSSSVPLRGWCRAAPMTGELPSWWAAAAQRINGVDESAKAPTAVTEQPPSHPRRKSTTEKIAQWFGDIFGGHSEVCTPQAFKPPHSITACSPARVRSKW